MEKIKDIILIITSLITVLGIFVKVTSSIMIETIKTNFENIPGEKSIFQIILKISVFFMLIMEFFVGMGIIGVTIKNLFNNNLSLNNVLVIGNDISIALWVVMISFVISAFGTMHIFFDAQKVYVDKLNGKSKSKFGKGKIIFNIINMIISAGFVIIILLILYDFVFSKVKVVPINGFFVFESSLIETDINTIGIYLVFLLFESLIFMLGFNVFEIKAFLTKDYNITIKTKDKEIVCKCYIEFKDYFLVRIDTADFFINKNEILSVEKKILKEKISRTERNKKVTTKLVKEKINSKRISNY